MKKRHIAVTILIFAFTGFSVQSIYAQVQKSNSISQWADLKPKFEESFLDVGDEKLVELLRARTIELMEARATLSNVDSITAQRTDLDSSTEILKTVQQKVSKVWTSRNLANSTADIIAGWNLAKLDPNYEPFTKAVYNLDSWQGIRVAENGLSANVVVTGNMTYVFEDRVVRDNLFQSQITVVKENGVWLLDDTVAIFLGESR
jgi:hypothetical protein